jgi:hypothetical protein
MLLFISVVHCGAFKIHANYPSHKERKFDYTIQKLCSGLLDTSNQNGRPEKIITGNRKIVNPSTYCLILSILLSGDIHINPGVFWPDIIHFNTVVEIWLKTYDKANKYESCL